VRCPMGDEDKTPNEAAVPPAVDQTKAEEPAPDFKTLVKLYQELSADIRAIADLLKRLSAK
jgi:hypothetical protein